MRNSIKKSKEFKRVYDAKKSFATKNLVMYVLKKDDLKKGVNSDMESNRLGISVSHKVGNSVVRHTLIRRMREIFKKNLNNIEENNDIVVVLRVGSEKKEFLKLNEEFVYLCKKHNILKKVEN